MLGRRQLREKAMQAIYAWKMSGAENADSRVIEKNMLKGVDQIYDLYVYLLNLLVFQKTLAENKIEVARNKQLPTNEDLNPNLRFVENRIFKFLEENEELNQFNSNNKQLQWDTIENHFPKNIFNQIITSEEYKNYMAQDEASFKDDKNFILEIYEKFIAADDNLSELMEDKSIYWSDDFHIGNSMVMATLKSFTGKSSSDYKLFKVYKDEDDKKFIIDLFRMTIQNRDETTKIISEKAKNWELDRIAALDMVILQMAITEFLYFKNIPPKVILNEYIELSKVYSTDKSNIFINGILDKTIKDTSRF